MRIQGPFSTHLPTAPPRRKTTAEAKKTTSGAAKPKSFQLDTNVDYLAAGEYQNLDLDNLSATAKKALQGYWLISHQQWQERQHIDVYV